MGGPGSGRKKGSGGFKKKSNPRVGYEKTGVKKQGAGGKVKVTIEKGYYGKRKSK
jgi:hypothetical protein